MKKILVLFIAFALIVTLSACSKIEESDAKEIADKLIEYIEQGDYDSAATLFCDDEDEGKTFPEFLRETELTTGLDFQNGIEIKEYLDYRSVHSDSYFGVPCGFIELKTVIDGKMVILNIDLLENEEKIECYQFCLKYNNVDYYFLCWFID